MNLFGFTITRKATKRETSDVISSGGFAGTRLGSRQQPMLLSTVYRCVDLISDSVASLPLKIYALDKDGFKKEAKDHPLSHLLDYEPNEFMTRFVMNKILCVSALNQGNGYAYIERGQDLHPTQLLFFPSEDVRLCWVSDKEGTKHLRYRVNRVNTLIEPADMVHIKNFSYDGIVGVSTLSHARQTLGIATANDESVLNYFEGGQAVTGILTHESAGSRLTEAQKKEIYDTWKEHTSSQGGLQIIPGNMKYQSIGINPKDSQMLESRLFNVSEICRFYGVSPVKAFDLSKSSYSTVEATQLQYLVDTILPWITKFEQELNRKLLLPSERGKYVIEFDTSTLLRTDKAAQATYWKELFNIGAATPNEIRQKSNLPRIEGGDNAFVQVNVQTLRKATSDTAAVSE